jgi:hypothetical protein
VKSKSGGLKRKRVGRYSVHNTLANKAKHPDSEVETKSVAKSLIGRYSDAGPDDKDYMPKSRKLKGTGHASHERHTIRKIENSTVMDGLPKTNNHSCTLPLSQRPCWCMKNIIRLEPWLREWGRENNSGKLGAKIEKLLGKDEIDKH